MTWTSYFEFEPDPSPTWPCAVSGERLAGVGLGGLLLDGNTIGESEGVAELEGIDADVSGVAAISGPSATGGVLTGLNSGEITGAETGDEALGGGVAETGDGVGGVPLGLTTGETVGSAGDFAGETDGDGDLAGGVVDTVGEIDGAALGGEWDGEVEGDGEEDVGELAGEDCGECDGGGGGGLVVVMGLGEGAGALSACTITKYGKERTKMESTTTQCMFEKKKKKNEKNKL